MRAAPISLALALAACGGGGSHDAPGDAAAPDMRVADAVADAVAPDAAVDATPPDAALDAGRPTPAPAVPIQVPFWTPVVPVTVNDLAPLPFLLDTGAPDVRLSPDVAMRVSGQRLDTLAFGGRTLRDVPFGPYDLGEASGLIGVQLGGILGESALEDRVVAFDYRRALLYPLDAWDDAYDFGAHVAGPFAAVPFQLGGQDVILVKARFEGLPDEVTVILDTGTSSAVVSQALFDALHVADDGRTVLQGSRSVGPTGEVDSPVFRLRSVRIGAAEARKAWATALPDNDFRLISTVLGADIQAIVGGTYLREFLTAIDYPGRTLHLAPYVDLSHVDDEFRSAGIEVIQAGGGFRVYAVYAGSDAAAQGIARDDELLELDGRPVAGMSLAEVLAVIRGPVGEAVSMRLRRGADERVVSVRREDLLPDP